MATREWILAGRITAVTEQAGSSSVQQNLEDVARAALAFFREGGNRRVDEAVASYLRAEQQLGRVATTADPDLIAAVLMGACQRRALDRQVLGDAALGSANGFARELAITLMCTLAPDNGGAGTRGG